MNEKLGPQIVLGPYCLAIIRYELQVIAVAFAEPRTYLLCSCRYCSCIWFLNRPAAEFLSHARAGGHN